MKKTAITTLSALLIGFGGAVAGDAPAPKKENTPAENVAAVIKRLESVKQEAEEFMYQRISGDSVFVTTARVSYVGKQVLLTFYSPSLGVNSLLLVDQPENGYGKVDRIVSHGRGHFPFGALAEPANKAYAEGLRQYIGQLPQEPAPTQEVPVQEYIPTKTDIESALKMINGE